MSLAYLRVHYVLDKQPDALGYRLVACGRLAPNWARRTTFDPDYVTCESCLGVLTKAILNEVDERQMTIEEILDRRG